ncbi:MAG TPA: helix-turn-helix transcriptional regulator [Thermoanaerobaculia bacterium]|nr:helix-turn-helix transcriptional regulator [Thermoanaerobaculia bacterium]
MTQSEQTRWVARMLEAAIQAFGLSERELEKRLGWNEGALSDVLAGRVELHSEHVLAILDGLSVTPRKDGSDEEDLDDSGSFLVEELIGRSRRLGFDPEDSRIPDYPPPQGAELERRIRTVLREAFGEEIAARDRFEES